MTKKELRYLFRKERSALSEVQRIKLDDLLLIQFQRLSLPQLQTVLSYWPIEKNNEPNSFLFTDYLAFLFPGLQLCYPKTNFVTNEMDAIAVNDETLFDANEKGIYEPKENIVVVEKELDLIIVPLLAFDKKGNRVGYGKGFYDRLMSRCSAHCLKIGLSYFDAVDKIDDNNEFDVPLDSCITPQSSYVF